MRSQKDNKLIQEKNDKSVSNNKIKFTNVQIKVRNRDSGERKLKQDQMYQEITAIQ